MERERDWQHLGREFAAARKAAGLSQVQAADQLRVTRSPIQAIERGRQPNGRPFNKVTSTMRAYARLIGWTEDSPEQILDGGQPEPAPEPPPVVEPPKSDLPPAIELELRSGKTLDSSVIHLGSEDDDTRVIVVLKGAEDISDEELDRRWQQWRKARRHLQGIASDTENSQGS